MTREEYLLLFEKYLSGKATPEEIKAVLAHQDDFEFIEKDATIDPAAYSDIEDQLLNKLNSTINEQQHHTSYKKLWWAAASITLFIALGAIFMFQERSGTSMVHTKNLVVKNDIKPAHNNTLLTLANGKQIVLNEIKTGTALQHGNIRILKKDNGLLYVDASAKANTNSVTPEYNTISTPVGGHYEIVLPDGSKVWMNAASSLKFPSVFTGGERKVELTGEAYFEVAKNRHSPFKVKFNSSVVEVLGTHFNIMAYSDEAFSRTTLLEGSVRISKNNIKKVLLPGQQAVCSDAEHTNAIDVGAANEEEATAWKNNVFLFHNTNIKTIMRQLARWYDIEVVYQGNTTDKDYGIRMSKSKNLSEVLKNLELTGTIHFTVNGRRVTVME